MPRRHVPATGVWSRRQMLLTGAAAGAAAMVNGVQVIGQGAPSGGGANGSSKGGGACDQ